MSSINTGKQSVQDIDARKRALEFKNAADLRRLFNNMAKDATNLYLATGVVQAQGLATNYRPEFLKEVRDIMRKSLKQFGFTIRKTLEEKYDLLFDVETKLLEIELDFKRVQKLEDSNTTDAQLEKVNNDFLLAASLFVANESEKQVDFITQTNEKDINAAFALAGVLFLNRLTQANNSGNEKEAERLVSNQRKIIAEDAKKDIIKKGRARSDLIAAQNVGMTEAWARQKEAELLNDAELIGTTQKVIKLEKTWNSILDSKTRENHVAADGQVRPTNQPFDVGGEQLQAPRLGSIPANNINCRCVAEYNII